MLVVWLVVIGAVIWAIHGATVYLGWLDDTGPDEAKAPLKRPRASQNGWLDGWPGGWVEAEPWLPDPFTIRSDDMDCPCCGKFRLDPECHHG